LSAQVDLLVQRQELDRERTLLQQQILDMERTMDSMYANILRQRQQPYGKTREDEELLEVSTRNDKLISRYYVLTERIAELDMQIDEANP